MQNTKVALITGGTGDIGSETARRLSKTYGTVIALDVAKPEISDAWQARMKADGFQNVLFRHIDVCSFENCQEVLSAIGKEFGRIDALVNAAGITRDAVFYKMTKEQWDLVLSVNLGGMFNVTRHVVEFMRAQEYGRIVNISSINGEKGQFSQANYAASKAGVYGFTKSLAQELISKNITVNSISPGYVNTRMMQAIRPDILAAIIQQIPAKRLAEPSEIAWVIAFLLSDESAYITGANVSINGGLLMS
jgi:acetoacetyl-CoA reductase